LKTPIATSESYPFPKARNSFWQDVTIACQSGLSAVLCLGFPAGIVFWLVLLKNSTTSVLTTNLLTLFTDYVGPGRLIMLIGTITWGFSLGRISGYRQWGWLAMAVTAGVFIGQYPILIGRLDLIIQRFEFPVHIRFGIVFAGAVLSVMLCTGIALGLVLLNWKAAFVLAVSSGFGSVLGAMAVFVVMDQYGIRVGSGNLAMVKVTAAGIMTAATLSGGIIGVVFSHYWGKQSDTA